MGDKIGGKSTKNEQFLNIYKQKFSEICLIAFWHTVPTVLSC